MNEHTNPGGAGLDDVFSVLADADRRAVLRFLDRSDAGATLEELGERLASAREDRDRRRAAIQLYHIHLPKLESAGLVVVDDGEVSITGQGRVAETVRSLAARLADGDGGASAWAGTSDLHSIRFADGHSKGLDVSDPERDGAADSGTDGA